VLGESSGYVRESDELAVCGWLAGRGCGEDPPRRVARATRRGGASVRRSLQTSPHGRSVNSRVVFGDSFESDPDSFDVKRSDDPIGVEVAFGQLATSIGITRYHQRSHRIVPFSGWPRQPRLLFGVRQLLRHRQGCEHRRQRLGLLARGTASSPDKAIPTATDRRNVTFLRFSRWNVTLRRSVNPEDAWTGGAASVSGNCLVPASFVLGLSPQCHVPAIGVAGHRRNVTLPRFSRWNVTLRR